MMDADGGASAVIYRDLIDFARQEKRPCIFCDMRSRKAVGFDLRPVGWKVFGKGAGAYAGVGLNISAAWRRRDTGPC
jgi:hypothetical protein